MLRVRARRRRDFILARICAAKFFRDSRSVSLWEREEIQEVPRLRIHQTLKRTAARGTPAPVTCSIHPATRTSPNVPANPTATPDPVVSHFSAEAGHGI